MRTKSALKAKRVAARKTIVNRHRRGQLEQALKRNRKKTSAELRSAAQAMIDKAAKHHLLHPRKAARMVAKLYYSKKKK